MRGVVFLVAGLFCPGGVAVVPQGIEILIIPQGVHALPEARVRIHGKLPLFSKADKGFLLQFTFGRVIKVVQKFAFENEVAAVDILIQNRLFLPRGDIAFGVGFNGSEAGRHTDAGKCADLAGFFVERNQRVNVNVGDSVAIGDHEAIGIDVLGHLLDTGALERFFPGIAHGNLPVRVMTGIVADDFSGGKVHGEIGIADLVFPEILLDILAFVSQREHEILVPVSGVPVHDMPDNRPAADFHHGLGLVFGFFAHAGAFAAAENDCFHIITDHWLEGEGAEGVESYVQFLL